MLDFPKHLLAFHVGVGLRTWGLSDNRFPLNHIGFNLFCILMHIFLFIWGWGQQTLCHYFLLNMDRDMSDCQIITNAMTNNILGWYFINQWKIPLSLLFESILNNFIKTSIDLISERPRADDVLPGEKGLFLFTSFLLIGHHWSRLNDLSYFIFL